MPLGCGPRDASQVETATGASTRSLGLPKPEWEALDRIAGERGMATHAAMREANVQWLARACATKVSRAVKGRCGPLA